MAINSNQSYFASLDDNLYLKNLHHIESNCSIKPHPHDGWICYNSPSSNFCLFNGTDPSLAKNIKENQGEINIPNSSSSYFNKKNTDFEFSNIFHDFINSRLDYLEKLKHIGDNWINGNSVQPPINTIDIAKVLLKNIRTWFSSENCKMVMPPRIIMSPIPKGGVSIELYINDELNFLINIYQNSIELEKDENGYYSELQVTPDNVLDNIISEYNNYDLIKS